MFRKLLTLEEAKAVLSQHFTPKPIGTEEVSLLEAYNRVLSEDIISDLNIPPFNRSTVDGYAVKAQDTFGAEENKPVMLKICGEVNIGELPKIKIVDGEAAEIVTGAPIPEGADAVVMLEHTERKDDVLYIYKAVVKDENVMKAGADIRKGEKVLKAGKLLGSKEIGVLAALGKRKIQVYKTPNVAVLSTGAEISEPGIKLLPGKIYDINAYSLSVAVAENCGTPLYLGVFPDDEFKLYNVLKNALASADVILTSGGVSVGPTDVVPKTVDSLGKPGVIVNGIAIKPGKPTTIAIANEKPVFSLPGHPTSALLVFHLLVRPIIQRMAGLKRKKILKVKAFASARMISAKGRRTFIMVKLKRDKSNRLLAVPVPTGLSGAITTMARANGFVEIPENQQFVDENEKVVVCLF